VKGMHASTGKPLEGEAHLAQSIARILTTPIGSRVMRRDFGSMLPELIDQPANNATAVRLYGATATAILRWEPRFRPTAVALSYGGVSGSYVLDLDGYRTDTAQRNSFTRLSIPLNFRA
jgi:uncharacterized protein